MSEKLNCNEELDSPLQSRREFLERAGKFALYTPPTITMLMYPGVEAIASGVTHGEDANDVGEDANDDNNDDKNDD